MLLAWLVLIAAACSPSEVSRSPSPTGSPIGPDLPPPRTTAYPGIPWTFEGHAVDASVITMLPGQRDCGFDDVVLLTVGWPIGRAAQSSVDARQYVRDPSGRLGDRLSGTFDGSTTLPTDAVSTGFKYGSDELVMSPSDAERYAYVVRGGATERWPRAKALLACG